MKAKTQMSKLVSGPPELTPQEIVWAYCANEMWSGYPCCTEGCPYCGGPEEEKEDASRNRRAGVK